MLRPVHGTIGRKKIRSQVGAPVVQPSNRTNRTEMTMTTDVPMSTTATNTPEALMQTFAAHVHARDLDALMGLYEHDAVFMPEPAVVLSTPAEIRAALGAMLSLEPTMVVTPGQVLVAGDVALVQNDWSMGLLHDLVTSNLWCRRVPLKGCSLWLSPIPESSAMTWSVLPVTEIRMCISRTSPPISGSRSQLCRLGCCERIVMTESVRAQQLMSWPRTKRCVSVSGCLSRKTKFCAEQPRICPRPICRENDVPARP